MSGNGADGDAAWIRAALGDEFCRACYLEEKRIEEGSAAASSAFAALGTQPGFLMVIGGYQCRACRTRGTPCQRTGATIRYVGTR